MPHVSWPWIVRSALLRQPRGRIAGLRECADSCARQKGKRSYSSMPGLQVTRIQPRNGEAAGAAHRLERRFTLVNARPGAYVDSRRRDPPRT